MKMLLRIFIVLFGCLLLTLNILSNEMQPSISHRVPLEVSWVSALAATLHYDLVSGRDYYYTYGVLSQIVAYFGFIASGKRNIVLSYLEIVNSFRILNIVLFGAILLLSSKSIVYTILILIYTYFINILTANAPLAITFSFRGLILLLQAFIASQVLTSSNLLFRRLGSLLFGVSSLVSQLFTAELGLYSAFLFVLSSITLIIFNLKLKCIKCIIQIIESNLIMLISYFVFNIFLSIIFLITSRYSVSWFDYQLYTLELMRGYASTMGVAWAADLRTTATLLFVVILVSTLVFFISRNIEFKQRNLLLCLFFAAFIYTRQATLRSDIGHVLAGFIPMIVVLLLLINWLSKSYLKIIWFTSLILLAVNWPLSKLYIHGNLATASSFSSESSIEEILSSKVNIVHQMKQYLSEKYILNFPSENYIGIMLNKEIVAPVLLAHNAHTLSLQKRYVEMLKMRQKELNITYSLDNISTGAIDRVQHVSRIPFIFDYLWQNYKLKTTQSFDGGVYVLQPRDVPSRPLPDTPLRFGIQEENRQLVVYLQQRTAQCPLVKIEMRITYPPYAFLGRPNGIWARFFDDAQLVHESGLVAIETNQVFYTYISLLDDKEFYRLFSNDSFLSKQWNKIALSYRDTGFMGVNPSDLQIAGLYCVSGRND